MVKILCLKSYVQTRMRMLLLTCMPTFYSLIQAFLFFSKWVSQPCINEEFVISLPLLVSRRVLKIITIHGSQRVSIQKMSHRNKNINMKRLCIIISTSSTSAVKILCYHHRSPSIHSQVGLHMDPIGG
jgi:hypothetical protein